METARDDALRYRLDGGHRGANSMFANYVMYSIIPFKHLFVSFLSALGHGTHSEGRQSHSSIHEG